MGDKLTALIVNFYTVAATTHFACAVGSKWSRPRGVAFGEAALHHREFMMEAAGTNVTLHFSIHLPRAGKSPQLSLVFSK